MEHYIKSEDVSNQKRSLTKLSKERKDYEKHKQITGFIQDSLTYLRNYLYSSYGIGASRRASDANGA